MEATKTDTPKGAEVQCPTCWRLFSGDSTADRHETWTGKGHLPTSERICHDPASKGLVPVAKRGLVVWHTPEGAEKTRRGAETLKAARARRATLTPGSVK